MSHSKDQHQQLQRQQQLQQRIVVQQRSPSSSYYEEQQRSTARPGTGGGGGGERYQQVSPVQPQRARIESDRQRQDEQGKLACLIIEEHLACRLLYSSTSNGWWPESTTATATGR